MLDRVIRSIRVLRKAWRGLVLVTLLLQACAIAAGFDCRKAHTFVERAICGNKHLSTLDDRLENAYRSALAIAFDPEALKEEQRRWLTDVRNRCQDNRCLNRAYEQRLQSLSGYADRQRSSIGSRSCKFSDLSLPDNYSIVAAGGYAGRLLDFQIDQSGHKATQMDVAVHFPAKPVVLMLGAHEPTIWQISWSSATRIVAVLVSGYHRQAIAGLDPSVPLLNISFANQAPCGNNFFDVMENDLDKINPLARRFFGRAVDIVYLAKAGNIVIGDAASPDTEMLTSNLTPAGSFFDKAAPLAGLAGLEDAVQKGLLRKATESDADEWVNATIAGAPIRDVPPLAGVGRPKPARPGLYNAYVVLKPFTYPSSLTGGNMAIFFIPKGVPTPRGDAGYSTVYNFNGLRCQGILCRQ